MLLIALVAVGGFTVLAQRRLRSLGMLGALGATDRNIRLVVRANGVVVGVAGALVGPVLGLAAWLAYRPRVESDAHHVIGPFQLPWVVIGPAMALAVVATYFAASRPARADHPDPDRDRAVRAARPARSRCAARPCPAWSSGSWSPWSCSATPARPTATAAAQRWSWSSASSRSSRR